MKTPASLACEILAPRAAQAGALAEVASLVARKAGQSIIVKTLVVGPPAKEAALTLHLPVELAGTQHQIWCLACQLACFCPDARISVLISGESTFADPPALKRGRKMRHIA